MTNIRIASPAAFGQRARTLHRPTAPASSFSEARSKILKLDGTQRSSAFVRDKLVAICKQHRDRVSRDPDLAAYLDEHERGRRRDHDTWLSEHRALSTSKGLDCGRGAGEYRDVQAYAERSPQEWVNLIGPVPPPLVRAPPDDLQGYPALNIGRLLDRGWLKGDRLRATLLGWPLSATGEHDILLFDDRRETSVPLLVARIGKLGGAAAEWQNIGLIFKQGADTPRYFECPLRRARCDTLYFRNGVLASRQAQRLYHASQRPRQMRPR